MQMQRESDMAEPQPAWLGRRAEGTEQERARQARADCETWAALAEIGQSSSLFYQLQHGYPRLPKDADYGQSAVQIERRIHATMAQKFQDIREVLLEFDGRLVELEVRTKSAMQSRPFSDTQSPVQPRVVSRMPHVDSRMPRVDSRMQVMMKDAWWMQVEDLMHLQAQSLRSNLDEKGSKPSAPENIIAADSQRSTEVSTQAKPDVPEPTGESQTVVQTQLGKVWEEIEALKVTDRRFKELDSHLKDLLEDFADMQETLSEEAKQPRVSNSCPQTVALPLVDGESERDGSFAISGVKTVRENIPELTHSLAESIWEAALLAGMPYIGVSSSVITAAAVIANIFVQLTFCAIIGTTFTKSKLPDIKYLEFWRAVSHDEGNADPITGASLVSRVCGLDPTLSVAGEQGLLLENIQVYNGGVEGFIGLPCGPLLFSCAWLLWSMCAFREAMAAITFARAVFCIPRGKTIMSGSGEGGFILEEIHSSRLALACVLTFGRLLVCISLAFIGSLWLANELNVRDLVLNASALGFVMELDEMIYEIAMTRVVKAIMEALAPLALPAIGKTHPVFGWFSDHIGFPLIVFFLLMCFAYPKLYYDYISVNVQTLRDIQDTLCGGEQDFVYKENPEVKMLVAHPTKPFDLDGPPNRKMRRMMRAARGLWRRSADDDVWVTQNEAVFTEYTTLPISILTMDQGKGSTMCWDMGQLPPFILSALRFSVDMPSAASCHDLFPRCGGKKAKLVRAMCSKTCGCRDPMSGLYLAGPSMGCPRDRCTQRPDYKAKAHAIACQDPTSEELQKMPGWKRYWDEFAYVQAPENGGFYNVAGLNASATRDVFMAMGCLILLPQYGGELLVRTFCLATEEYSSIAMFCPLLCGCRDNPSMAGCPPSCSPYHDGYKGTLEVMPCENMKPGSMIPGSATLDMAIKLLQRYDGSAKPLPGRRLNDIAAMNLSWANATRWGYHFHLWAYLNRSGCPALPDAFPEGPNIQCSEAKGASDVTPLCPLSCGCHKFGGASCPRRCIQHAETFQRCRYVHVMLQYPSLFPHAAEHCALLEKGTI